MSAPITFATLCSGVEAVSLAWEPLGFEPVFFAENAPFPSAVLAHHWPHVPNLGDLTKITSRMIPKRPEVLWASFPCQAWSEAGRQAGLDDPRGRLTLDGLNLVDFIDPDVFCFENVPQLLKIKKDNPFGQFLGALAGESGALLPPGGGWPDAGRVLGPRRAIAWRVLDAQFFGLPQQRRRLFVVASPRTGGINPGQVLHESGAVFDSPAQRRSRGQDAFTRSQDGPCGGAIAVAVRGRTLNGFYGQQLEAGGEVAYCLRASQGGSDKPQVLQGHMRGDEEEWSIRDLMPIEAERCMGLPDNHTLIPGASDARRYHAIGNSLPVPVVAWLGERIKEALRP